MTQAEPILKTLEEHGPLDRDALGELLSEQIPAKSLETVLSTLKSRNKVGRTDAGSWYVTESGEDEAGDGEQQQQNSRETPPAPAKSAKRPYTRAPKAAKAATSAPRHEFRLNDDQLNVHIAGNEEEVLHAIRSLLNGLLEAGNEEEVLPAICSLLNGLLE